MRDCNIFLDCFILVSLVISVWTQNSDACGGMLKGYKGVITSPDYPNHYPPDQYCIWEIEAPPKHPIALNFTNFDLENDSSCSYDNVIIRSRFSQNSEWLHKATYCGEMPPFGFVPEGNVLQIAFTSDHSLERSGFSALYSISVKSECGSEISCDNDSKCIGRRLWCDGTADCEDESDEKYCRIKTRWNYNINNNCNAERHFTCKNGMCIPKVWKCDGHMDCYDHSDETRCDNENLDEATDSTDVSFETTTELYGTETVSNTTETDWYGTDSDLYTTETDWYATDSVLYTTETDWVSSETQSMPLSQNPSPHPVSGPVVSTVKPTDGCFDETGPSLSNSNAGSAVLPFSNSQSARENLPVSDTVLNPKYLPSSPRNYLDISINFPFGQRWPGQDTPLPIDRRATQSQGMGSVPDYLKSKPPSAQSERVYDRFSVGTQDRNVRKSDEELSSRYADASYRQNDYVPRPLIALFIFPNSYPTNIRVNG